MLKAHNGSLYMTLGEFWTKVNLLCGIYDGRVTSGFRSRYWNHQLGGATNSLHLSGFAADVVLRTWADKENFMDSAKSIGIAVIDEIEEKVHLHLQPK